MKRMQARMLKSFFLSERKLQKCNFKSNALARPRMLKSFFLSDLKLNCNYKSKALRFFSWNEMLFAMQKTDFHMLELFCRASHVRASMHRINSLELLRTLMLCLAQLSKLREWRPWMLKASFLSERKFLNAILRVKLKYMKDVSFSWNEMLFAMQKTDFHVLELVCRASHVRASMHRITSLELLRTLMLCLVQLSKLRECKATDAESFFLSERKLLNAILWIKLKYIKDVSSHEMKCYLQCRSQIFMC